jgi:capsid portal protein
MDIDQKLNTQSRLSKDGNSRVTIMKSKEPVNKTDVVTTLPINTDPVTFDNGLITPPFENVNLYRLRDNSSPLAVCLLTISRVVADYGYRIEKKTKTQNDIKLSEVIEDRINQIQKLLNSSNIEQNNDINTQLQEKLKDLKEQYKTTRDKEIEQEREDKELQSIRDIFENVHPEKSINQILKETCINGILYGYSGIEVIFDSTESSFMLENIPTHELYYTERELEYTPYIYIDSNGKKRNSKWKFRRYAQKQATGTNAPIYFRELYDPRHLNFKDGNFYPSLPDSDEANICIPFKFGVTADCEYPHPIWLGETNNILGYEYATRLNKEWFEEGMMVPMVILFNGMLDAETYEELKAMLSSSKGLDGRTKAMIIENTNIGDVSKSFDMEAIKTKFDMKVERLPAMEMSDGQFLKYLEKTIDNTRMVFNLPAILLGMEKSYNRATATIAFEMAEAQVFGPYRKILETGMNNLLRRMGIYDYVFKLNSPTITDYSKWQPMLKPFLDQDVIPINEVYSLYNEIFNRDLEAKENKDLFISEYRKRYLETLRLEEDKLDIDGIINNNKEEVKQESDSQTHNLDQMYNENGSNNEEVV